MGVDKSWMNLPRTTSEYQQGVDMFLDFAFANSSVDGMILCACHDCGNSVFVTRSEARDHLIYIVGFIKGYTKWTAHRETSLSFTSSNGLLGAKDDTQGLLYDALGISNQDNAWNSTSNIGIEKPNEEAEEFYKLLEDAQEALYPGCQKFSKLSFVVRILYLKCIGKMSNMIFDMWLNLLNEAFPEGVQLPKSFYEAKKIIEKLGLNHKKYDACKNDCMLYWGVNENKSRCDICQEPRWPTTKSETSIASGKKKAKKVGSKVMWYFPLKPRLQRLFMSSKTASLMKWHMDGRTKDGYMRHPADSLAWQIFDTKNPEFARDSRNARLGLASDGFNPFKTMNVAHSTWPVLLMPYNLPPWMFMKPPYILLSLLIPGPSAPGNNIDIYLQPLIAELQELWDVGVNTYDASSKENFQMRAAILWTISDFPGYATLSGWSTKGALACPVCHKYTHSTWLKHSGKHCYMGHRRFLDIDHPFRKNARSFNGTEEFETAPPRLTASMVNKDLNGFTFKFGKLVTDNPKLPYNWKKRSIFHELPYWKDNVLPHSLDVMHIEKNACESLIGTILNLEGKTKDHLKARLDLQEMNIRPGLHPVQNSSGRVYLAPSCFSLDRKERGMFSNVIKRLKVPDGYASNISRCVQLKPPKLSGLKSHDYHVLMQQILPLALRKQLPKFVRSLILRWCRYFKELCSKVLRPCELFQLEKEIVQILCEFERIFPPSFFDVMVHLTIHLATEAKIGGPVHYRWMYPIERYLCTLKSYVRNRSRPEGSIAIGYLVEECLTFCSMYLADDIATRFNRLSRNEDDGCPSEENLDIFSKTGRPLGNGVEIVLEEEALIRAH